MDLAKQIRAYNKEIQKGAKPGDDVMKQFSNLATNASKFSPAFKEMAEAMEGGPVRLCSNPTRELVQDMTADIRLIVQRKPRSMHACSHNPPRELV